MELPTKMEWIAIFMAMEQLCDREPLRLLGGSPVLLIEDGQSRHLLHFSAEDVNNHAVSVFSGEAAIQGFLRIRAAGDDPPVQTLIAHQDCLTAYRGESRYLSGADHLAMRNSNYKAPADDAFIYFRRYRPGYTPWYIESADCRLLTACLREAARLLDDIQSGLLAPADGDRIPARVLRDGGFVSTLCPPPQPASEEEEEATDELALARLRRLPRSGHSIEADCIYLTVPVRSEIDDRLLFPRLCIIADRDDGVILDQAVPEEGTEGRAVLTDMLLRYLQAQGRPRSVVMRQHNVAGWLRPLCRGASVELIEEEDLEIIDDFLDMLAEGELPEEEE